MPPAMAAMHLHDSVSPRFNQSRSNKEDERYRYPVEYVGANESFGQTSGGCDDALAGMHFEVAVTSRRFETVHTKGVVSRECGSKI